MGTARLLAWTAVPRPRFGHWAHAHLCEFVLEKNQFESAVLLSASFLPISRGVSYDA